MAFERIMVSELKRDLLRCKNSLSQNSLNNIKNKISNSSIWQGDSQKKLYNSIEKLQNIRYRELENLINKYIDTVSYIEEYKRLEQENEDLTIRYQNLNNELYKNEEVETTDYMTGETYYTTQPVLDRYVQNQMMQIDNTIASNKARMSVLVQRVSNSL